MSFAIDLFHRWLQTKVSSGKGKRDHSSGVLRLVIPGFSSTPKGLAHAIHHSRWQEHFPASTTVWGRDRRPSSDSVLRARRITSIRARVTWLLSRRPTHSKQRLHAYDAIRGCLERVDDIPASLISLNRSLFQIKAMNKDSYSSNSSNKSNLDSISIQLFHERGSKERQAQSTPVPERDCLLTLRRSLSFIKLPTARWSADFWAKLRYKNKKFHSYLCL